MKRVPIIELDVNNEDLHFYKSELFTGVGYGYEDEDKRLEPYEYTYLEGQLSGPAKSWGLDGRLISLNNYEYNLMHGFQKDWYENGNIKSESYVEHGFIIEEKQWDENGALIKQYKLDESDPDFSIILRRREALEKWLNSKK